MAEGKKPVSPNSTSSRSDVRNASDEVNHRVPRTSALSGRIDYVDLAERVGQGVTVEPRSKRWKSPNR
jgi:hypothetical protein